MEQTKNSLSDQVFLFASDVQQALALVFTVKDEKAVKQLVFVEILHEALLQVNVLFMLPGDSFTFSDFELFVVHDLSQLKPEAILALVAVHLTNVLVLVVSQLRQQPGDVDPEELVSLFDLVAFKVQAAELLEKPESLDLEKGIYSTFATNQWLFLTPSLVLMRLFPALKMIRLSNRSTFSIFWILFPKTLKISRLFSSRFSSVDIEL